MSVHFVGIGGAGMSGLARLLLARGVAVSGSDCRESPVTRALAAAGARVVIGHRPENVHGAQEVVYTAAVQEDHPELVEARRLGLPIRSRAELLARLMEGRRGIAVAGTHGKTTTTAMVASILLAADLDPTVLVGGEWRPISGNARAGEGAWFVTEACEAFHSFLALRPEVAIVTNIDADHLECHGSLEGVVEAFRAFLERVAPGGLVIGCRDDERVRRLVSRINRRVVTYGLEDGADYVAVDLCLDRANPSFTVVRNGMPLGEVRLRVPGRHNVLNALAAAALAAEEAIPFEFVERGLRQFAGVGRRFETLGEVDDVLVVDDYAHHPAEIRATLDAARSALGRYTLAVFQPHLFSRTQLLMEEFARSFDGANRVFITEIYAAREAPIPGVTGEALAHRIRAALPDRPVEYVPDREALVARLLQEARPGDLVLTMGAGDIREVGERLVAVLRERFEAERFAQGTEEAPHRPATGPSGRRAVPGILETETAQE